MTDITLEQAREAWLEVVSERGEDYVYSGGEGCWYGPHYSTDGNYSCAIGGVISKLAPDVFVKFKEFEHNNTSSFTIRYIGESAGWGKLQNIRETLNVDPETLDYLALIQSKQDAGYRYYDVLSFSEELYENLLKG